MADARQGVHVALPYDDQGQCVEATMVFAREAIASQDAIAVAVSEPLAELLKPTDVGQYARTEFYDTASLALNPGRLIPAIWDLAAAHPRQRVWWIEEPSWPGRDEGADIEVIRHEALTGLAFASEPVSMLCLYDRQHLRGDLLERVPMTHAQVWSGGRAVASPGYLGPGVMPPGCDEPAGPPPPRADALDFAWDLGPVRRAVSAAAGHGRLDDDRCTDLVLAASEAAANSLRYGGGRGVLTTWVTESEVICQVEDTGTITDPLAGRRRGRHDADGHGLWVINQLCDLVEVRSRPGRTTVRMRLSN